MSGLAIIGAIVLGLLAGGIAERAMNRQHGILTNLIVGLVGAFLGAWLAHAVAWDSAGLWAGLAVSAAGAVILVLLLGRIRRA